MVRSAELFSRASPKQARGPRGAASDVRRHTVWLLPLCLVLSACAQTYPRTIVPMPEATAPAPVYAPAPQVAMTPEAPRVIVPAPLSAAPVAAASVGPRPPDPNPDPVPATAPAPAPAPAPLAPYAPQASPLLAYDSAPRGVAPPAQPERLPSQVVVRPRVVTYYTPYYRNRVYVNAPYYHVRPYYGYRPYPLYSGGPRFGIGWYGGVGPRRHYDYRPRHHHHHHHGYGHGQRHGRR